MGIIQQANKENEAVKRLVRDVGGLEEEEKLFEFFFGGVFGEEGKRWREGVGLSNAERGSSREPSQRPAALSEGVEHHEKAERSAGFSTGHYRPCTVHK